MSKSTICNSKVVIVMIYRGRHVNKQMVCRILSYNHTQEWNLHTHTDTNYKMKHIITHTVYRRTCPRLWESLLQVLVIVLPHTPVIISIMLTHSIETIITVKAWVREKTCTDTHTESQRVHVHHKAMLYHGERERERGRGERKRRWYNSYPH